MNITRWNKCRLCSNEGLDTVLDFGNVCLPKWPVTIDEDVPTAPLEFCLCPKCRLGQLRHSIDRNNLFLEYWYKTGINSTMRSHMEILGLEIERQIGGLKDEEYIIDIGCNDGTFLSSFPQKNKYKYGFEPSQICPDYDENGPLWINDFFSPSRYPLPNSTDNKTKVITTLAMFYYIDDPIGFAKQIKSILRDDGIWVCEMNYAVDMVEKTAFDHISHEHVTIWTAKNFVNVVKQAGMRVFKIERNKLNGGSIRFWSCIGGAYPNAPKSIEILFDEVEPDYAKFVDNVKGNSGKLYDLLHKEVGLNHKTVMCYGSSTRGITLLASYNLCDPKGHIPLCSYIKAAVERNPDKVGRYYGNMGIPIISEDEMRNNPPDYLLILPYSFLDEFKQRERTFLDNGGKFILPVPTVRIISKEDL